MGDIVLIFLAGVAGSAHCLGMCGGFACALGKDGRGGGATLRRHLLYNLGRITTYCFFGAVAGHVGLLLVGQGGEATSLSLAQRALALVSGLLMLVVGLQFLGVFGRIRVAPLDALAARVVTALRMLLAASGSGAPLALGVANGLLPCPLVYAFVAQAAASGGALSGLATMVAFGLGTLPMMLLAGGIGARLRASRAGPLSAAGGGQVVQVPAPTVPAFRIARDARLTGVRIAGVFILVLGVVTCARGVLPMAAHVHGL